MGNSSVQTAPPPEPQSTRIPSYSKRPKLRCLSGGLIRGYSIRSDYVARSMGAENGKKGTGKEREGRAEEKGMGRVSQAGSAL
jgi:hypothetical protein